MSCERIETILASIQEEVDDLELSYKLRTARQLNVACECQNKAYKQTLEEAYLDRETTEQLQQMGHL